MEIDFVNTINSAIALGLIIQLFIAFVLFFYIIFAFLVVRQVRLLNKSFQTDVAPLLVYLSYGHFFATLFLFLFTLITIV